MMKKIFCFLLIISLALCVTACNVPEGYYGSKDTSSVIKVDFVDIGTLTSDEAFEKVGSLKLDNGYSLVLKSDSTSKDNILYTVKDSENKEMIDITILSDAENKLTELKTSWKYGDFGDDKNRELISIAETVIISLWQKYSNENMKKLNNYFAFTLDEVKYIEDENKMITAPANDGDFYLEMYNDVITFGIHYSSNSSKE